MEHSIFGIHNLFTIVHQHTTWRVVELGGERLRALWRHDHECGEDTTNCFNTNVYEGQIEEENLRLLQGCGRPMKGCLRFRPRFPFRRNVSRGWTKTRVVIGLAVCITPPPAIAANSLANVLSSRDQGLCGSPISRGGVVVHMKGHEAITQEEASRRDRDSAGLSS